MEQEEKKRSIKGWFLDLVRGLAIGVSCDIPGASGGTTAVLVGCYDNMINSVSSLFKSFKKSFLYLLPILLGIVIGLAGIIKPMDIALDKIPFSISCLFAGVILGSLPMLYGKIKGKFTFWNILIGLFTCGFVIGICFIPGLGNYNLDSITFVSILLVFLMGILGSFALVIPGVSGALVLLIFGFYKPLLGLITDLFETHSNVGLDICFIIVFCLGIIVGFFCSSKAMGILLKKKPVETYFGIIGFVIGSIFAVYTPFMSFVTSSNKEQIVPSSSSIGLTGHILLGVGLMIVGIAFSLGLYLLSIHNNKKKACADGQTR